MLSSVKNLFNKTALTRGLGQESVTLRKSPFTLERVSANSVASRYVPPRIRGRPWTPSSDHYTIPETLAPVRDNFPVIYHADIAEHKMDYLEDLASEVMNLVEDHVEGSSGALLVRNLPFETVHQFNSFINHMNFECMSYLGGIVMRMQLDESVWASSQEPPEASIDHHTEMSYKPKRYPSLVLFYCLNSLLDDGVGGETTICDVRRVFSELGSGLLAKLEREGIKYIRDIADETVDVWNWQGTFQTSSREEVERFCAEEGWDPVWNADGSLTYSYVLPAVIPHPKRGHDIFFNHLSAHHETLWSTNPTYVNHPIGRPYPSNTTFGGGDPIDAELLGVLRGLNWKHSVGFKWQAGDLLVMDNMHVAHAKVNILTEGSTTRNLCVTLCK